MTIKEFIDKQNWTFSKTYAAFAPHEYIVRIQCDMKNHFDELEDYILENGMDMFFYGVKRKYLFLNGMFYWVIKNPKNPEDVVINRCKPEDYDIVFMKKDTWNRKKDK